MRADILATRIAEVRREYSLTAEMKWVRVSRAMLPAYRAFVDVFLECIFSRFRLHTVIRGTHWKDFGRDEDQRFFKAYYVFLRYTMSLYRRYDVYVDDKPGKRHRWTNVQFAVNQAIRRDYELTKGQIRLLKPLDSKKSGLLQVTDIILGALTSKATSPHKQELTRYIRERLENGRRYKVEYREWSPRFPN